MRSHPIQITLAAFLCGLLLAPQMSAQWGGQGKTLDRIQGIDLADSRGNAHALGDVDGDGIQDFAIIRSVARFSSAVDIHSGATRALLYSVPNSPVEDALGLDLAMMGDLDGDGVSDYVLSARNADHGLIDRSGAIYAYSGAAGTLLYEVYGTLVSENLGFSLCSGPDIDGDGFPELLVGNEAEYGSPIDYSSVYLLSGATGTELHRFDGASSEYYYGVSVAFVPDKDGDGLFDIAIGRPDDPGALNPLAGAVEFFSSATFLSLSKIEGAAFANMGWSMTPGFDFDGDGIGDLLAQAREEPNLQGYDSGLVRIYSGADDSVLQVFYGRGDGDRFGTSIETVPDVDGDGFEDILIGAPFADPGGHTAAGEATVFSGATGAALHRFMGSHNHDNFGNAVAGVGDLNGDGFGEILVDSPGTDLPSGDGAGEVFVFSFQPFLQVDSYEVSASAGATLQFELGFPVQAALQDYLCLMSLSGAGSLQYGITIPLQMDAFLLDSALGNYPFSSHAGLHGTLDATASGSASIDFPPGFASQAVGFTFRIAAVTFPSGQLPNFSSVSVPITILP